MNTIKRTLFTITIITILFGTLPTVSWASQTEPLISAESCILIDMKTGTVLFEKNADTSLEPASITKVITGLLTIENLDLEDAVTIDTPPNANGNGMNLAVGEVLTVKELLYGMMVHSSNDAAVVLSEQLAASRQKFNQMATDRASRAGATHTVVTTPNGLNDVKGNVTTARDLALICTEAMKNPIFRKVVATVKTTIPANQISPKRVFWNSNLLLYDTKTKLIVNGVERTPKYEGAIGIKTGETSTAGCCVVAAAQRNGTELLAVVLNAPDKMSRFADAIALLDYGYNNYYTYEALKAGVQVDKVPIAGSSKVKVSAVVPDGYFITLPKEASVSLVTQKITLKSHLTAPMKKGTSVGTAAFYLAGDKIGEVQIYTSEAVKKGGPWTAWGIPDFWAYALMTLSVLVLFILFVATRIRRKKKKVLAKRKRMEEARIAREQKVRVENKQKRDWPY